jgi:hypothetical protein
MVACQGNIEVAPFDCAKCDIVLSLTGMGFYQRIEKVSPLSVYNLSRHSHAS